jgi:hypothetical protein
MHDAYLYSPISGPRGRMGFAAELRAIAERMSEEWPLSRCEEYGDIYRWLLTEADRAEAGDAAD